MSLCAQVGAPGELCPPVASPMLSLSCSVSTRGHGSRGHWAMRPSSISPMRKLRPGKQSDVGWIIEPFGSRSLVCWYYASASSFIMLTNSYGVLAMYQALCSESLHNNPRRNVFYDFYFFIVGVTASTQNPGFSS